MSKQRTIKSGVIINNENVNIIGINEKRNMVCIQPSISNFSDNDLIPMIVKKPVIKESILTKYKLDNGVELKNKNGIINHENKGPQYPFMEFSKSPIKYF